MELSIDLSGGNRHDDSLDCADLNFGNPHVLGNAKVVLHSRVAAQRHGRSKVNHEGCFRLENLVVAGRIVEIFKNFGLISW
jgi:hypothetical protein